MSTLHQALDTVKAKLPMDDIQISRRFDRAYDIITKQGGYELTHIANGLWYVHRASTSLFEDNSQVYKVDTDAKSCTCPDWLSVRAGLCKHRIAVMIKQEMCK